MKTMSILFVGTPGLPLVGGAQNGSKFEVTVPSIRRGPELPGRERQYPTFHA